MKFIKYLLISVTIGLPYGKLASQDDGQRVGQETAFERQINQIDMHPIREFVESKENISIKEKQQNLELSGDVRFEYRNLHEKGLVIKVDENHHRIYQEYESLRGNPSFRPRGLPISNNDFDVEFNFKLKYTYDKAWFAAHLQYDNPAGIRGFNECFNRLELNNNFNLIRDSRSTGKGSGEGDNFTLKRAYMGYTLYADGVHRWNLEIGRRKLNDVFDSEIEFSNRFDGIVIDYVGAIGKDSEWYWTAGAFVVDERVNRFGCAFEIGWLSIAESNLDFKYSLINWLGNNRNRCLGGDCTGFNFLNSQFLLEYNFELPVHCKRWIHNNTSQIYGAFLVNHAARKCRASHYKNKNLGAYAGIVIGDVNEKGDWSANIEFQIVEAQAIADFDVDGICRGNIQDNRFYDVYTLEKEHVVYAKLVPGRGNTNFKGWKFELLYAVTDNFSLDLLYQFSSPVDKGIGGPHHYSDFKTEAIYAF